MYTYQQMFEISIGSDCLGIGEVCVVRVEVRWRFSFYLKVGLKFWGRVWQVRNVASKPRLLLLVQDWSRRIKKKLADLGSV